jgi:hypothetical protein
MESGYPTALIGWQADKVIPGLEMGPKAPTVILDTELGKPEMLPKG